jgi:hypothetical protein
MRRTLTSVFSLLETLRLLNNKNRSMYSRLVTLVSKRYTVQTAPHPNLCVTTFVFRHHSVNQWREVLCSSLIFFLNKGKRILTKPFVSLSWKGLVMKGTVNIVNSVFTSYKSPLIFMNTKTATRRIKYAINSTPNTWEAGYDTFIRRIFHKFRFPLK